MSTGGIYRTFKRICNFTVGEWVGEYRTKDSMKRQAQEELVEVENRLKCIKQDFEYYTTKKERLLEMKKL